MLASVHSRDVRVPNLLKRPPLVAILVGLAAVVLVFFAPILPTYFLADDYNYVWHLFVHAHEYVQGENLSDWFIAFSAQGLENPMLSVFFRPVVQWLWLTDYVAWGTNSTGYHLTNLALHVLNSFWVVLLANSLLRNRWGAIGAGLLFALHPVHADSVAWIADRTDVLSTFFYFASATYFVLYRRGARRRDGIVSVVAFALAIGTKENTVALPVVLLAHDLLFDSRRRWGIARAQVPYWLVLAGYVAVRVISLGQFGRNTGGGFLSYGWELFAQFYTQALAQPFLTDIDRPLMLAVWACGAAIVILARRRRAVWFGVAWVLISLVPSASAAYVAPRLAYAPSAGLALALAALLVPAPVEGRVRIPAWVPSGLLALLVTANGWGLAARVDDWRAAGAVASAVVSETQRLHPALPPGARLYYTGVPDVLRTVNIYNDNLDSAIGIAYRDQTFRVYGGERFPVLAGNLDQVYFLEYARRKITERTDLLGTLRMRQQCPGAQRATASWDFAQENRDWQLWNQLEPRPAGEGALRLNSTGTDANLGGPALDLPALTLGEIEIEMRVRASAGPAQGAVLWMTAGQTEFSPAQQQTFAVQADEAWHTYRVDIVRDGRFQVGDRVTRLRLDPVRAVAEIDLRAIRINGYCPAGQGETCQCP